MGEMSPQSSKAKSTLRNHGLTKESIAIMQNQGCIACAFYRYQEKQEVWDCEHPASPGVPNRGAELTAQDRLHGSKMPLWCPAFDLEPGNFENVPDSQCQPAVNTNKMAEIVRIQGLIFASNAKVVGMQSANGAALAIGSCPSFTWKQFLEESNRMRSLTVELEEMQRT